MDNLVIRYFKTVNCANGILCTSELFLFDVISESISARLFVCVSCTEEECWWEFHGNKVLERYYDNVSEKVDSVWTVAKNYSHFTTSVSTLKGGCI